MNARQFIAWVGNSRKGAHLTYHTGNLQFDRQDNGSPSYLQVNRVADAAWAAYAQRKVELKQRRMSDGVCAYVATRL